MSGNVGKHRGGKCVAIGWWVRTPVYTPVNNHDTEVGLTSGKFFRASGSTSARNRPGFSDFEGHLLRVSSWVISRWVILGWD